MHAATSRQVWDMWLTEVRQGNLALTVNVGATIPFYETYKGLSSLHYIESRLAPLEPLLASSLELASKLGSLATQLRLLGCISVEDELEVQSALENACARLQSYQLNLEFVLRKIRSAAQLVRFFLVPHQLVAADERRVDFRHNQPQKSTHLFRPLQPDAYTKQNSRRRHHIHESHYAGHIGLFTV